MALMKWDSMKDIEELVDRYTRSLPWHRGPNWWASVGDLQPRVDISEADGAYLIKADIPGIAKEDLRVSVEDGMLTIEGERHQEERLDKGRVHRLERFMGSFSRSFSLPADAETAGLHASADQGLLRVTVPRKASSTSSPAVQVPVE